MPWLLRRTPRVQLAVRAAYFLDRLDRHAAWPIRLSYRGGSLMPFAELQSWFLL